MSSPYWTDRSLRDFKAPDLSNAIAVLPIAAIEQHGPHLPFGVDTMIMEGCLTRVIPLLPQSIQAIFLPIQNIGVSLEHLDFAGTLTLQPETAARLLVDISQGVFRTGVRKIVLMNSHGGNSALISQVALDLRQRFSAFAVTCSWSRFGYPEGLFDPEEIRHGIHGGDIETSLMLEFRPDLVDMTQALNFASRSHQFERDYRWLRSDRPAGFGWMAQDLSLSGAMGDASRANAEKGAKLADHWARSFIELLSDVASFDIAYLRST
jgi:creatinine amidohydrolase